MGICRLVPWSAQPRDAPSVVVDRVKTQTDILKFSNLQQVFLEIGPTVSSTAAPWKHEHRRKMMRIARTVIEAEGFSWILPGLLEQTSDDCWIWDLLKRGPNREHRIEAFLERLDPSPPRRELVTLAVLRSHFDALRRGRSTNSAASSASLRSVLRGAPICARMVSPRAKSVT
jgi:hypothetical protein